MRKFAPTLVLAVLCAPMAASAQAVKPDPYTSCYFRPEGPDCQRLMSGKEPAADSIRAAYEGYGRYVQAPSEALTQSDRRYLADNAIDLPDGLTAADQSGLHKVINDPALANDPDRRRMAVNNFLRHAMAAEFYCAFDACSQEAASPHDQRLSGAETGRSPPGPA